MSGTAKIDLTTVGHDIWSGGKTWAVIARLYFLRKIAIKQSPGLVQLHAGNLISTVEWLMKQCSTHEGQALVVVLVKFPFDIRLDIGASRRSVGGGTEGVPAACVIRREIHAEFGVMGTANDKARIIKIRSGTCVGPRCLRQEVELGIRLALVHGIA